MRCNVSDTLTAEHLQVFVGGFDGRRLQEGVVHRLKVVDAGTEVAALLLVAHVEHVATHHLDVGELRTRRKAVEGSKMAEVLRSELGDLVPIGKRRRKVEIAGSRNRAGFIGGSTRRPTSFGYDVPRTRRASAASPPSNERNAPWTNDDAFLAAGPKASRSASASRRA
jgi:hypothetical protein